MTDSKLQVIPLGGMGEFGMNSMALRYSDDIIVIDAGMMFPEAALMGVDIVTPDFAYLEANKSNVRALILTHAHEDHIGATPFLLSKMNIPVYDILDAERVRVYRKEYADGYKHHTIAFAGRRACADR